MHYCLPGPVDGWAALLYNHLLHQPPLPDAATAAATAAAAAAASTAAASTAVSGSQQTQTLPLNLPSSRASPRLLARRAARAQNQQLDHAGGAGGAGGGGGDGGGARFFAINASVWLSARGASHRLEACVHGAKAATRAATKAATKAGRAALQNVATPLPLADVECASGLAAKPWWPFVNCSR